MSQDAQGNLYLAGYGKVDTTAKVNQWVGGYEMGGGDSSNIYTVISGNGTTLRKINAAGVPVWFVTVPDQSRLAVAKSGNSYAFTTGADGKSTILKHDHAGLKHWEISFFEIEIKDLYVDAAEMIYMVGVTNYRHAPGAVYVCMIEPVLGNMTKFSELPRDPQTSFSPENIVARNGAIAVAYTDRYAPDKAGLIRFHDESIVSSGFAHSGFENFTVFPNPGQGAFTLHGLEPGSMVCIYNTEGKCVYSESSGSSLRVNISAQPAGVYFVKVQNEKGVSCSRLIVF